jgi:hypothetical protein
MSNVVIPVAMQTLCNVVVVKPILRIELGTILVREIVRPEIIGLITGEDVCQLPTQFPKQPLIDQQCVILR